ncbi:SMa0974 family conjugal transfer regulator [Sinorhizobium terangae]
MIGNVQHAVESYVCVSNSRRLVDEVAARTAELCQAVAGDNAERALMFEEGKAIMKATKDGLLLWIGARSHLMCHSLQVAIESNLFLVMPQRPAEIPWYPGEGTPFAVIERLLEKPQGSTTRVLR